MPVTLTPSAVALRIVLTVIAGLLIGLNRGERGHAAGLRTTLLVCLAASIAMIQANLLMGTVGKAPNSFVVLDLMRLPLGILSGIGFIGAGAILRRGNLVRGVTTAATMWFVTVMGLCFGGGQIVLGIVALGLGLIVLWGLKWVEQHIAQNRHGTLTLVAGADGPTPGEIQAALAAEQYRVTSSALTYAELARHREFIYQVTWRARPDDSRLPSFLGDLAVRPGVVKVNWNPQVQ